MRKNKQEKELKRNDSSIEYRGNVRIDLLHGKKKYKSISVKNSGTSNLFLLMARLLCGEYEASQSEIPSHLQMFGEPSEQNRWRNENILSESVIVSSVRYYKDKQNQNIDTEFENSDNRGYILEYSFLVPSANVDPSKEVKIIALFNSADYINATPLAYIKIPSAQKFNIEAGANIAITWRMYLANKSSNDEN